MSTLSIHDLHTYDLGMSGMREFGALIKRAREQRGLTQAELGARIGYTHSFVVRLERGQMTNPPTSQTMRDLERELGVSRRAMLEAMGYLDPPVLEEGGAITVRPDDPRADLLARLDDATDDEIDTIKGIINVIVSHSPQRGTEGVLSDGKPKQSDDAGGRTA